MGFLYGNRSDLELPSDFYRLDDHKESTRSETEWYILLSRIHLFNQFKYPLRIPYNNFRRSESSRVHSISP